MLKEIRVLLSLVMLLQLLSCTPSPPYEVRSPCVTGDPIEPTTFTPCVRRPANFNRYIT